MVKVNYVSDDGDGHQDELNRLLIAELGTLDIQLESLPRADLAKDGSIPLLYSRLDTEAIAFLFRAVARALMGRRTTGLFFRPGECFLTTSLKYRIKNVLFRIASRLPNIDILILMPFAVHPGFQKIATGWIYDPQLWDLVCFGFPKAVPFPGIDDSLRAQAEGRRVVVALGGQNRGKGFDYMADLWDASPKLREEFLFVAAGKVGTPSSRKADRFAEQGGMLINRRISDDELLHMYTLADAIWSCYAPDYNQASGIFGRAVQLGTPAIVRENTYIENIGNMLHHPMIALPFDAPDAAAAKLLDWKPATVAPEKRMALIQEMRNHSLTVLSKALTGK